MTQQLEKLSTNVYVLWVAISIAGGGGWATCAYLNAISSKIDVQTAAQTTHNTLTDYKLQELTDVVKEVKTITTTHDAAIQRIQQTIDTNAQK